MSKPNGCGPAWLSLYAVTRWIRRALFDWFFEASCNKHDEGYQAGGDEIRRFLCDWRFFQAMRRDTLRKRGPARLVRWIQAVLFFALVRAFGWRHFNYTAGGQAEGSRASMRGNLSGKDQRTDDASHQAEREAGRQGAD